MEIVSLHPIDEQTVSQYVDVLAGAAPPPAWETWFQPSLRTEPERARTGSEPAANRISFGLARALSGTGPVFTSRPFGLSFWEAQVDRSLGMLMRPPSRLLQEAGLDRRAALRMPIRLDAQLGMMGGAWIPARLVPNALQALDDHLERSARRLLDAELDPYAPIELLRTTLDHAHERGMGVLEAQDLIGPDGQSLVPVSLVVPDPQRLPAAWNERITLAITPPKKPGLFARLRGRGQTPTNGHHPETDQHPTDVTPFDRRQEG